MAKREYFCTCNANHWIFPTSCTVSVEHDITTETTLCLKLIQVSSSWIEFFDDMPVEEHYKKLYMEYLRDEV